MSMVLFSWRSAAWVEFLGAKLKAKLPLFLFHLWVTLNKNNHLWVNFKQSDYLWVKFKQKDHLWVNFKQKDHLWVNFKHFRPSVGTPLFSQFWVVLVDTKHATSVCECHRLRGQWRITSTHPSFNAFSDSWGFFVHVSDSTVTQHH